MSNSDKSNTNELGAGKSGADKSTATLDLPMNRKEHSDIEIALTSSVAESRKETTFTDSLPIVSLMTSAPVESAAASVSGIDSTTPSKPTKVSKVECKTSQAGLEHIKTWEGFRLRIYKDTAGLPTIGVGTLITREMLGLPPVAKESASSLQERYEAALKKFPNGISEKQALDFLRKEILAVEAEIAHLVKVKLSQNQFDAVVSFTYNVGAGALAKSTLLKKLNAGDFAAAADEFLKWAKNKDPKDPTKYVTVQGLMNRRQAERALFLRSS